MARLARIGHCCGGSANGRAVSSSVRASSSRPSWSMDVPVLYGAFQLSRMFTNFCCCAEFMLPS
ncbi:hypothetical protein ACFPRL_31295 [Pseudoclavibacter helvolus]